MICSWWSYPIEICMYLLLSFEFCALCTVLIWGLRAIMTWQYEWIFFSVLMLWKINLEPKCEFTKIYVKMTLALKYVIMRSFCGAWMEMFYSLIWLLVVFCDWLHILHHMQSDIPPTHAHNSRDEYLFSHGHIVLFYL